MPLIQVAIMCSIGRPRLQAACLTRLMREGELFGDHLARRPRIYFAGSGERAGFLQVAFEGFRVVPVEAGRPHLPHFWRVFEEAEGGTPLLFLENDVWIVSGGVPRIAALADELPADAGMVSFFDFRGESNGETFQPLDPARDLWGSQALLFTAAAVEALGHLARERCDLASCDSWDLWAGRAVRRAGLKLYLHAPSLVQHLGLRSEVWPERPGPTASNFPEPFPFDLFVDD